MKVSGWTLELSGLNDAFTENIFTDARAGDGLAAGTELYLKKAFLIVHAMEKLF